MILCNSSIELVNSIHKKAFSAERIMLMHINLNFYNVMPYSVIYYNNLMF